MRRKRMVMVEEQTVEIFLKKYGMKILKAEINVKVSFDNSSTSIWYIPFFKGSHC